MNTAANAKSQMVLSHGASIMVKLCLHDTTGFTTNVSCKLVLLNACSRLGPQLGSPQLSFIHWIIA